MEGTKPRCLDGVNISSPTLTTWVFAQKEPSPDGHDFQRAHLPSASLGSKPALGSFTDVCSNLLGTEN